MASKTVNQEANLRDKLAKVQDKSATKEANLRAKLAAVTEKKATQEANLRDQIARVEANAAQKEQKLQASLAKVDANEARRVLAINDRIARLQAQGGSGSSVAAMDLGFVHTDAIGTPRKITRASDNTLIWQWNPDEAWGGNLPDASSTITYNLRFPGQFYDSETGLHENRFRFYDPKAGRYLQPDPIGLAGGMHRYQYVNGDPINETDPLGLLAPALIIPARMVAFGIAGGVTEIGIQLMLNDWDFSKINLSSALDAASDAMLLGLFPGSSGSKVIVPTKPTSSASSIQACESSVKAGGKRKYLDAISDAEGSHTVWKTNNNGEITNYQSFYPNINPLNPNMWIPGNRTDIFGKAEFNKATQTWVETPHTHDISAPGGIRPAYPIEIPGQ